MTKKDQGHPIKIGRHYHRLSCKDRIIKVERIDGEYAIGQNLDTLTGAIIEVSVHKWFVGKPVHHATLKSLYNRNISRIISFFKSY
jgi:CTP synthase (UTP-ammonia lyase)